MNPRVEILSALLAVIAIAPHAEAEDPERVRPSSGTVRELRKVSTEAVDTLGEYLDAGHDWLYRRLQHAFEDIDVRFAQSEHTPIVVPLSPLRIGFASEFVHRRGGVEFATTPQLEASVGLPKLERRLRVFITSDDLQESPGDPPLDRNPVRAGLRFVPQSHISFEFGVRAKIWPAVFGALRWTPEFHAGALRVYPFAKTYVESGLGLGTSGGITFEQWSDRWIVRSASYGNWVRNTSATDWTQSFIVGYARAVIEERRYDRLATGRDLACGAVARVSVSGDRVSHTSLYEASVLMKRPLHGGWLYGYVGRVVRWERA